MNLRRNHSPAMAGAKAGFSLVRLPVRKPSPTQRRRPANAGEQFIHPCLGERSAPDAQSCSRIEADGRLRTMPSASGTGLRDAADAEAADRAWRAVNGPDREVIFHQEHPPGRMGLSGLHRGRRSWHHHRRPVARLPLSLPSALFRLQHAHVVLGGESFVALAEGLQNALWSLGSVAEQHRSDSLSAASAISAPTPEDLTTRYEAFCGRCGITPTRNNPGVSHENRSIERRTWPSQKEHSQMPCCCVPRATSTIFRHGGAFSSTRSLAAATRAMPSASIRSGWR